MLSIIIPVFNAENYISQCIESVLNQTYADWELILVNDGSTDNSLSIIKHYSLLDKRIVYVDNKNGGPSNARNTGLKIAKGEYISFIDSDDWVDDNYAEAILSEVNDFDIIFFGVKKIFENRVIRTYFPKNGIAFEQDKIESMICRLLENPERCAYFGFTFSKAFKADIIKDANILFNENLCIREDELFALQYCSQIKSCKITAIAPYNYRISDESLSHSKGVFANYAAIAREITKASRWITNHRLRQIMDDKIFNYCQNAVIESIKYKGDVDSAIEEFIVNYMNDPMFLAACPKWLKSIRSFPLPRFHKCLIKCYLNLYIKRCN